jgi:hypothetical protein
MKNLLITTCISFCIAMCYAQEPKEGANQNAADNPDINSGYLLPEVNVIHEVQPGAIADDEIAARADEFQDLSLRLYAVKLEKAITENETTIASIKEKLKQERGKEAIKKWHAVTVLEIQNEEMKRDLRYYLHYGKGSWSAFQQDFNEDMPLLKEDLARMEQEVQ